MTGLKMKTPNSNNPLMLYLVQCDFSYLFNTIAIIFFTNYSRKM